MRTKDNCGFITETGYIESDPDNDQPYWGIWVEESDDQGWLLLGRLVFSTPSFAVAKAQLQHCELHGAPEQIFTLREF